MSPALTPVRIRGKRSGAQTEKWTRNPRRRGVETGQDYRRAQDPLRANKAVTNTKRRKLSLSRLEELPTEILQAIFTYSDNLDLPLASPRLATQLSNRHLWMRFADDLLGPVITGETDKDLEDIQHRNAQRLLGCRFMTWGFFTVWLVQYVRCRIANMERDGQVASDTLRMREVKEVLLKDVKLRDNTVLWVWLGEDNKRALQPPRKLLRGPWDSDRVDFLRAYVTVYGSPWSTCTVSLNSVLEETAYEGLSQAVAQNSIPAVVLLIRLSVQVDQKLLRKAIVDCGCKKDVVLLLLASAHGRLADWESRENCSQESRPDIDFLDPVLWNWADQAIRNRSPGGEFVKSNLTQYLNRRDNSANSRGRERSST